MIDITDLEVPSLDPQYVERTAPQVILNKMTKSKFDSITKEPDQLYAITDAAATSELVYGSAHSNVAASAQTAWTNYITVTVPENGIYRIEAVARVGLSELAANRYVRERIVVNGSSPSTLAEFNEVYMPGATDYYANSTVTDMGVATLSKGQTVALQFRVQGSYDSRIQIGNGDLFILKLA